MKIFMIIIIFLLFNLNADKKTVCLNMIVKNEKKVIKRCLNSVKNLIDYWVIVDTGSTDGTQDIIIEHMKDIPGELHQRPWKDFAQNRNEAFALAKTKADYLLFIDADDEFVYHEGFTFPKLDKDFYLITSISDKCKYRTKNLVKASLGWKWKGPLREVIDAKEARSFSLLSEIETIVRKEGYRWLDPGIYLKDIQIFADLLKKDPKNKIATYSLAQCYKAIGENDKAITFFQKRAKMSKYDFGAYHSYLNIALMYLEMNKSEDFIDNMYKAYTTMPNRAEPLYYLAKFYRDQKKYDQAYTTATLSLRIPYPTDTEEVESWIYEYGLYMECFRAAFHLERYGDALVLSQKMFNLLELPKSHLEYINARLLDIKKMVEEGRVEMISLK